jgi:hypothetical protein
MNRKMRAKANNEAARKQRASNPARCSDCGGVPHTVTLSADGAGGVLVEVVPLSVAPKETLH